VTAADQQAMLTTVAPLRTVAPFRIQAADLGPHGYVPEATLSVLDVRFNALPDQPIRRTDRMGAFSLTVPANRPLFLNIDYGTTKRLCLFAYVKAESGSIRKLHVNVPTTLAATVIKNRFKDAPGAELIDWEWMSDLTEKMVSDLASDDVPILYDPIDVMARTDSLVERRPVLKALMAKFQGLLVP
jgi:hypothetical protein